jgi:hypothetical protein
MEGMRYLKKARFDVKFDSDIDMVNSKYTFKENHFGINELMLHFDGFVAMPDDESIDMDLTFATEKTSFKSVLSLVPAVYMKDFESVKTSGEFNLSGMAKGKMVGDQLPAFNLDLNVSNGFFQYPDLPRSAKDIAIALNVQNPGGSDDKTLVDLKNFSLDLGGNPVKMKAYVKTPVSDPDLLANINASVDLGTLKDVIPAENNEQYAGKISMDVNLEGRMSTLEAEDYENFKTEGSMILEGIEYNDPTMDYPVAVNYAEFGFSPKQIDLTSLKCQLGKSDIIAKGYVADYLPYYFKEETLSGSLDLGGQLLDLNELAGLDEESTEETTEEAAEDSSATAESAVVEIPVNIDFVMISGFKKVLYDNIVIENVVGKVSVKEGVARMDNLKMDLMKGQMVMSGAYSAVNPKQPDVDFFMAIDDFDIPMTVETFNTVKTIAPIVESASGSFSTELKFVCVLDQQMEPVMNTLTGGGVLETDNVKIENSETLDKIADVLKKPDLKNIDLQNVDIKYEFRDGRVFVEPFDVKMGDAKATISGSNGFDQTLDYLARTEMPMSSLGQGADVVGGLLDQFNKSTGANVSVGDNIKVDIKIKGTVTKPKIVPAFGGSGGDGGKSAKDQMKDKAKEELDRLKKEAEQKAREEAARLRKEAEEQARKEADRLKKEAEDKARQEADRLKKEAEERARKEAEAAKKRAEEEAKKKAEEGIKKLFGK